MWVTSCARRGCAARRKSGHRTHPPYPFDDTDIYKVIEGASYTLSVQKDPRLEAYIDGLIAKIAAAQEPDGYLYTARTIDPAHPQSGRQRALGTRGGLSHELYNLGHLYESAVAHYQATGKRTLLDISSEELPNFSCSTFGPANATIYPGHQIVEMGLVKLYRVTTTSDI